MNPVSRLNRFITSYTQESYTIIEPIVPKKNKSGVNPSPHLFEGTDCL